MEGIWVGIILALVLVIVLEILRFFRRIIYSARGMDKLKRRVDDIEEFLKINNK